MPPNNTTTRKSDTSKRLPPLQVVLTKELHDQVEALAKNEVRSMSSMGARLIQEAIEARNT